MSGLPQLGKVIVAALTEAIVPNKHPFIEFQMQGVSSHDMWRWHAIVQTPRPAKCIDAQLEEIEFYGAQQAGGQECSDACGHRSARSVGHIAARKVKGCVALESSGPVQR